MPRDDYSQNNETDRKTPIHLVLMSEIVKPAREYLLSNLWLLQILIYLVMPTANFKSLTSWLPFTMWEVPGCIL